MSVTCTRPVLRHYKNAVELVDDTLAQEHCLVITHQGRECARTMCTPGQDRQLVLGRLFGDGLLHTARALGEVRFSIPGKGMLLADVELVPAPGVAAGARPRRDLSLEADQVFGLMQQMESAQAVFQRTGATHSAALFDTRGRLLALAEDIGRHNALDKVIGAALQQDTLHRACTATMSSRLSCELVQKAAVAGLTFLCGISVATSLAVDMAAEHGITLVGRVRGNRMNVYTHRQRILWPHTRGSRAQACDSAS